MLARVYMQLAGFPFNDTEAESKAKTYLEQLLAKKSQYWAPTIDAWRSQWLPSNANKYSVFAIQYRTGGSGNPAIFDMSPELPPSFTSIRIFGNHIYPNKALMYQFERTQSNGSKPTSAARTTPISTATTRRAHRSRPTRSSSRTLPSTV